MINIKGEIPMPKYSITQDITLPSKGLLNPEIPEGVVTQRCMMVSDQKYLAGSNVKGNKMYKLVQDTIISPDTFDVGKLTLPDLLFLSFKLRILSYGSMFKFETRCPVCGKRTEVSVNLSDVECVELDDDYEKNLEIVLPISGDTVYTKILTLNDLDEIDEEVKKSRRRITDDGLLGSIEYEKRLSRMIKKIKLREKNENGETSLDHPVDIEQYVSELTDLDATAIVSTTDNIEYGISLTAPAICIDCGSNIEVPIRFNSEFFRPKYDPEVYRLNR